nr:tmv resistance protein n [Quercus suber]
MILNELKLIDLSDSQNLIEIPDLSGAPNLKQLILQRCARLYKIHASLGDHKRLTRLDLNGCKRLESLPHKINLEALEFFNLSGCSKLKKFPDIVENMLRLSKLGLSQTTIKDCKNLSSLPIAICSLMSLKTLNLSGCSKLDELPENLGKIKGLEVLDLSGTAITGLPSSVVHLKNLKGQKDRFFHVEIPGSEIPKWFSHQNVGASMNLQVPSYSFGNKLMGIVVCAVFVVRQHLSLHQLHIEDYGYTIGMHYIACLFGNKCRGRGLRCILSEEFGKIESHQLWLEYFPSTYFEEDWEEMFNGFSQIVVKFLPIGPGLEVTKCGAHLVFEQGIEDLVNQTEAGPSSCIITPYDEDGFEDSKKYTKTKQSNDDSDGEAARPSGEATSNDVDEAHPKRIRV